MIQILESQSDVQHSIYCSQQKLTTRHISPGRLEDSKVLHGSKLGVILTHTPQTNSIKHNQIPSAAYGLRRSRWSVGLSLYCQRTKWCYYPDQFLRSAKN